jgi:hypothetical protein
LYVALTVWADWKNPMVPKYGIPFHTIRYWQNRAKDLWRYNGLYLGYGSFHTDSIAKIPARLLGHDAIALASVLPADKLKERLS